MMVRPEAISASSVPDASPLKSCEKKFGQVIMRAAKRRPLSRATGAFCSGVIAEVAAELVGLLHERKPGNHFGHFPVVLRVLHLLRRLALDDDDRPDQLVIGAAPVHLADDRLHLAARLIGLD